MKNKNRNARFGAVFGRIVLFGFLVVLFAGSASAAPQVDIKELTAKAEAGDGEAQFKLGARYYRGRDVPLDYEKAVLWWKKSAESGVPVAQFFLGECYAQGKGVQKDEKKPSSYIEPPPKQVSNLRNLSWRWPMRLALEEFQRLRRKLSTG